MQFKKYNRREKAELRPVTQNDIDMHKEHGVIPVREGQGMSERIHVSISDVDLKNGSPKLGDMIARNPKNHDDQWLVARDYFLDNFETNTPEDILS